jgi:murein DD-endopeptidase MepM/ murein hydrolase activator NlpD
MRVLLLLPLLMICAPSMARAQDFQLPIDCSVGDVCVVQNYVDVDARAGAAQDPMCGPLSYDGHDGLDIRAPAAAARRGVNVLAPAAGVVAGVRDGEPEGAFLRGGMAAVEGRECGNGVRIEHEGGWSSQLCHMRAGSLRVERGERVSAGQVLGLVGLSGHTQFPHVHLALRRGGAEVDPLTGAPIAGLSCGPEAARAGAHWSPAARTALSYRGARWFATGFTGAGPAQGVNAEDLPANASARAPALVFWALASGPLEGDVLRVRLYGPDGALLAEGARTQTRSQAQAWVFAGRRTPASGWPPGAYRGEAQLMRGERVVATQSEGLRLAQ